jgi:polar amino acid transport system substrate-binding protein
VIGLGNIARWVHLPNISKHSNLILRGVCTTKGYRAKHFGKRFKSEYCSTDYKQIIEDPDIDLIMICTRHDLHASMAIDALNAGKHVFVEKPMAMTKEDCVRLVRVVREAGLGFMVDFNRRYSPMYQLAKAATSGKGPKLISIRINSPDMTNSYWMMDLLEGGGAILGEGCHFFDLMVWFTDSEPVSVFAHNLIQPQDELTSKNNLACTISFEDGSVGNLVYETVGHRGFGSERVEISAGGTTAVVDEVRRLWIWDESASRPKKKKSMKAEKGHYQILNAFVDRVLKGGDFEKEALAGASATLCALAVLKSLETGRPEKVEVI